VTVDGLTTTVLDWERIPVGQSDNFLGRERKEKKREKKRGTIDRQVMEGYEFFFSLIFPFFFFPKVTKVK